MSGTHVTLPGSHRPQKSGATVVGALDADQRIQVTLSLRGQSLPEPDPAAPPLQADELARRFGASAADVARVTQTLEGYGLAVDDVNAAARSMKVSGTIAQMEAAFQPKLALYHTEQQGDFRGREGDICIPTELDGIVTGVFGLDQRRVAHRKRATGVGDTRLAPPAQAPLTPAQLATRYDFPGSTGAGQRIAIAEFDGGYFAEDLAAFCQKYSLPVPKVTTVPISFAPPTLAQIQAMPKPTRNQELDATIEVMMDVQVIAGQCPDAEIYVYFASFDQKGWVDLLDAVIAGTPASPVALSISWGLAEDAPDWSPAAIAAINDRLKAVSLLGITTCVSSGDDGSGDQMTDGRAHVDFPSSSPYVLSVGGTMLTTSASHTEVAWWESPGRRTSQGGGATGGGVSTMFARPAWQTVSVTPLNKGQIDGRVIPDVSALSGPPFYDLIFMSQDFPNGGTSASAPLWAALIARLAEAGKPRRFLPPLLYQSGPGGKPRGATGCRDIRTGQNASHPQPGKGFKSRAGYDAVTGWGVPDGQKLLGVL